MAYKAADIFEDIRYRVDDSEGKIKDKWLLHLLNMAQIEYAKKTRAMKRETEIILDPVYNAYVLPDDILELKAVKYAQEGVEYRLLYPMDLGERQLFGRKIVAA